MLFLASWHFTISHIPPGTSERPAARPNGGFEFLAENREISLVVWFRISGLIMQISFYDSVCGIVLPYPFYFILFETIIQSVDGVLPMIGMLRNHRSQIADLAMMVSHLPKLKN